MTALWAEGCGGGFAAYYMKPRVQRVQKVQRGRLTAPTEPRVLKFDSHFVAEGCGIALRAMSMLPPFGGSAAFGSENRTTAP